MATTVKTNKLDYAPGETVSITADGFFAGDSLASVRFEVVNLGLDGLLGTADDLIYPSWIVTDDATAGLMPQLTVIDQPSSAARTKNWPLAALGIQMLP